MSKSGRFFIILFVLWICSVGLWPLISPPQGIFPSINWYFLLGDEKEQYNKTNDQLKKINDELENRIYKMRSMIPIKNRKAQYKSNDSVILDIKESKNGYKDYVIDLTKKDLIIQKVFAKVDADTKAKFLKLGQEVVARQATLNEFNYFKEMRGKVIKLGLDLAGGTHLTLKVDQKDTENKLKRLYDNKMKNEVIEAQIKDEGNNLLEAELQKEIEKRKVRLQDEYEERLDKELDEATDRAMTVIRSRIDKFGVSEPTISKGLGDTIFVELPGLDKSQVEATVKTITEAGRLTFQIVDHDIMNKIPLSYKTQRGEYAGYLRANLNKKELTNYLKENENITFSNKTDNSNIYPVIEGEEFGSSSLKGYLILKNIVGVDGTHLSDAHIDYDQQTGSPRVVFEFDSDGGKKFARLTRENINKQLAIVLDDNVKSAPSIRSEIRDRGEITLGTNPKLSEVKRLVAILKAGALPGKIRVESEITLDSKLGKEYQEKGLNAILIGISVVIIFMLIYYRLGGLLAVFALLLNMFLLLSILSSFNFTLTLPGIAGIVLTVGMAVDANVIIFERIREENRLGKAVHSVIDGGYGKAFSAIFDSNLTTILAAFILSQIGSGIIKGFGFTLMWGIISSMFTSLFVTRFMFDLIVDGFRFKKVYV